jgi:hypothetical protein
MQIKYTRPRCIWSATPRIRIRSPCRAAPSSVVCNTRCPSRKSLVLCSRESKRSSCSVGKTRAQGISGKQSSGTGRKKWWEVSNGACATGAPTRTRSSEFTQQHTTRGKIARLFQSLQFRLQIRAATATASRSCRSGGPAALTYCFFIYFQRILSLNFIPRLALMRPWNPIDRGSI